MGSNKTIQKVAKAVSKNGKRAPRSLAIASKGITTGNDYALFMSAVMSDLIEGSITPSVGNAVCNAGAKLLRIVELQYRYGVQGSSPEKKLILAAPADRS